MRAPDISKRPPLWSLALGALHALLFGLSFPPVFAWPLAFVSLWPLLLVVWRTPKPARSALMVGLAVLPMWLLHHRWMMDVTAAGYPVLGLYLSIYAYLFVWLGARWRMRVGDGWKFWCALPVLWIGLEMLRGAVVWNGYPWYLLGHPTIRVTSWAAAHIGAQGASAIVAAVSVALAWIVLASPARPMVRATVAVVSAALLLVAWIYPGPGLVPPERAPQLIFEVVQTNVPQDNKAAWSLEQKLADFESFKSMSRPGVQPPDLIIWPETMFPGLSLNPSAVDAERSAGLTYTGGVPSTIFYDELLALQREIGVPMLVGAIAREGLRFREDDDGRIHIESDAVYNSAFVVRDGAVDERRYDKLHLTPFGEIMPLISRWDWLEEKLLALGAAGMSFELEPGAEPVVLDIPIPGGFEVGRRGPVRTSIRVATPICFEVTMPGVCRRLVFDGGERRADILINLTNDGWFGSSVGGRMNHLLAARWRCVELATPMIRAANTGISAMIDTDGRIAMQMDANEEVTMGGENLLSSAGPATLYARTGDLVGWLCLAATGLYFVAAVLPRRTPPQPGRSVDQPATQPTIG